MQRYQQSFAPFGSLDRRNRQAEEKYVRPGPGYYDISLPFIVPLVQTIKKKNNNVIVKLGHFGTASFQSRNNRFMENQISEQLGPGKYNPEERLSEVKVNHHRHRSYAVERIKYLIKSRPLQRATIERSKSINIDDCIEMPNLEKKREDKRRGNHKESVWSRMSEGRDSFLAARSASYLGPGEYYIDKTGKQRVSPSPAFKSETIKSFFDQIYFRTNQERLAKYRELFNFKINYVGPGSYNLLYENKSYKKFQFFGSTEVRKL